MFLEAIKSEVKRITNPSRAVQLMKFFKTGPGQYGQGDHFAGLTNPQSREIAKNNSKISLEQIRELIESKIHEERFIALVIMNDKYKKGTEEEKQNVFDLYLKQMKWVNGWDLVDLSAPNIIGEHLLAQQKREELEKEKKRSAELLYKWAESPSLWFRRISIISTFTFIRANRFEHTVNISEKLLGDKQDLIHKAVGWMLRQVGKRDTPQLEYFLKKHYHNIPRTALRYSIQKFEENKRKKILKGNFDEEYQN